MPFPAIVDFNLSSGTASSTPFAADTACFLDASIGELLVLWFWMPSASNVACRPPNEGTEWFGPTGLNQNAGVQCFVKYADGGETATTDITTHNGSSRTVFVRAERYGTSAHRFVLPVGTFAAGYDVGSLDPGFWNVEDTLWKLAACSVTDAGEGPSGYTEEYDDATNLLAYRQLAAASEDPGSTSGTDAGVSILVAARPRLTIPQDYIDAVMADGAAAFWPAQEIYGPYKDYIDPSLTGPAFTTVTASARGNRVGPFTGLTGGAILDHATVYGGNQGAQSASAPVSATNNMAMEFWWLPEAITLADQQVFFVGSGNGWGLYAQTNAKLQLLLGGIGFGSQSTTTFSMDTWYHIVFERDAGDWHLYVNGIEDATDFGSGAPNAPSSFVTAGFTNAIQHCVVWKALYDSPLGQERALAHYEAAQSLNADPSEGIPLPVFFPVRFRG